MKSNLGSIDKIVRIVLAAVFAYLYFSETVAAPYGIILLILGAVLLLTSLISFCPLYALFGASTKQGDK